jgi:hypothetical protein
MQVLPYTTDWLSRRFTKACAQRMFVGNNRAIVAAKPSPFTMRAGAHVGECLTGGSYGYQAVGAVAAILYALAFLLFPVNASPLL